MMNVVYVVKNGLYVNLTNQCPCSCSFCIRNNGDGAYGSDSLWLEREPSADEVMLAFSSYTLSEYDEIVFCGYGEPTERLDVLLDVCKRLKQTQGLPPIRLNTNGLSDLINNMPTARLFKNLVDVISVSLNTDTAQSYVELCKPSFGPESFEALQKFAMDCKENEIECLFTIVDVVSRETIDGCMKISEKTGIPMRIRKYDA